MKIHYYIGRIQFNAANYTDAIVSYLTALKCSETTDDLRMKGLICAAIGDTYNRTYCDEDNLKYKLMAHAIFQANGDSLDLDYSRINLGIAFHNCRESNKSDSILLLIHSPKLVNRAKVLLADNEIKQDKPNASKVISLFDDVLHNGGGLSVGHFYEYAYALLCDGRKKESDDLIHRLSSLPESPESLWWSFRISELNKDYDNALRLYEKYSEKRDSIVRIQLSQSVYKAIGHYYNMSSVIAEEKSKQARLSTIAVSILSLLLLLIIFLSVQWYKSVLTQKNDLIITQRDEASRMLERIQIQREEERIKAERHRRNLVAENNALSVQYRKLQGDYESKLIELRAEFASLYRTQFEEINNLFNKGYNYEKLSERTKQAYADKYGSIISELYDYPSKQGVFEARINKSLLGIMKKLRSDYPEFTEDMFRFASYVIVGFDACTLSFLLKTTKSNVWVKKHRLAKKILSKETQNSDLYKVFFNTRY